VNISRLVAVCLVAAFIAGCSDDTDRQVNTCYDSGVEAIVFMQNDPLCLDVHADIQFTVSDGDKEYVLLELLFDRGPPYNTPFSEIMSFPCVDSLQVDFMCYSEDYWQHFVGTVMIPVTCHEFNYIGVYADTINPLSIFRDYDGYVAVEFDELYKCAEVESLYFAWGSVAE
jgi:hypothetical protein